MATREELISRLMALMQAYAKMGYTAKKMERLLGRKQRTLKEFAKRHGIQIPGYKPRQPKELSAP
jgi:diketogulonate reductase-like aldo/keto reductase